MTGDSRPACTDLPLSWRVSVRVLMPVLLFSTLLLQPGAVAAEAQEEPPSIALALGSGGAGGLAHIAMLGVFDELGIRPARIAGTSIGALIGALYAAGLSAEEIRSIFAEFGGSELDVLSKLMNGDSGLGLMDLLELATDQGGLIDPQGFLDFLAEQVEARDFEDLDIPLEVIATDYWSGEMVVLDSGDLFRAVKASIAVPGLLAPVKHGEQLLIDGGTTNPLPFDVLRSRYDVVIAVDVTGARRPEGDNSAELTDLLFNTFEIMQQSLISTRMQVAEPDILIKPDTSAFRLLHFNRIEEILEDARPAAAELREALKARLGKDD